VVPELEGTKVLLELFRYLWVGREFIEVDPYGFLINLGKPMVIWMMCNF
jgi:hypothetical protein